MSLIFTRTIRIGGVLTDADQTPTLGIVRLDTGAQVVAPGTLMNHDGTGQYSYTLTGETAGVIYQASYSIVLGGETITSSTSKTATSSTTAQDMVDAIKTALKTNPAAVLTVIIDGQTVTYSRAQAIEELKFWQREAGREAGTKPRVARMRLDSW